MARNHLTRKWQGRSGNLTPAYTQIPPITPKLLVSTIVRFTLNWCLDPSLWLLFWTLICEKSYKQFQHFNKPFEFKFKSEASPAINGCWLEHSTALGKAVLILGRAVRQRKGLQNTLNNISTLLNILFLQSLHADNSETFISSSAGQNQQLGGLYVDECFRFASSCICNQTCPRVC